MSFLGNSLSSNIPTALPNFFFSRSSKLGVGFLLERQNKKPRLVDFARAFLRLEDWLKVGTRRPLVLCKLSFECLADFLDCFG